MKLSHMVVDALVARKIDIVVRGRVRSRSSVALLMINTVPRPRYCAVLPFVYILLTEAGGIFCLVRVSKRIYRRWNAQTLQRLPLLHQILPINPQHLRQAPMLLNKSKHSLINLNPIGSIQEVLTTPNAMELCIRTVCKQLDLFFSIIHAIDSIVHAVQPENRAQDIERSSV